MQLRPGFSVVPAEQGSTLHGGTPAATHQSVAAHSTHSPSLELTACPVCGATDCTELANAEEVKAEVAALRQFHTRRLKRNTPPGALTDRVAFSQRPPLRIVECCACGLVYRNPREREHELAQIYEGEEQSDEVLQSLHATQLDAYRAQAKRLRRVLGKRGSGLEVGSYVGGFLAAARESGMTFEGLDVNEGASRFARRKGFRVTQGDLESWSDDRVFDSVGIWNCFDQLPDPRRAARISHSLLVSGGILAIRVPNGEFYASMRRRLSGPMAAIATGLLAHNNLLSFPYRNGFTVRALTRLLGRTGFEVVSVYGDTLVPIADQWTRRWAAAEERAVKAGLRAVIQARGAERAPWIEVYARKG